jgi:hypothetical protein
MLAGFVVIRVVDRVERCRMKQLTFLALGALFGFLLSRARATDYEAIAHMFLLTDLHLWGVIGVAIASAALGLFVLRRSGATALGGSRSRCDPSRCTAECRRRLDLRRRLGDRGRVPGHGVGADRRRQALRVRDSRRHLARHLAAASRGHRGGKSPAAQPNLASAG